MDTDGIFSASEWSRYSRHVQLPKFGAEGQIRLKNSRVLIVGAGGLGSPVSLYLAAAGVGHITIIDHDEVELSNLQRQIAFDEAKIGQGKSAATAERLNRLNSDLSIVPVRQALTTENASTLIGDADLILDCTDNFSARYLINDTCKRMAKPWLFASIHQFSGQCALFTPETACFRCLYPDFPDDVEDCNAAGVLGVLPGLLGCFQAAEAIKYLVGIESPLKGCIQLVDVINLQFQRIALTKTPGCSVCDNPSSQSADLINRAAHCDEILSEIEVAPDVFSKLVSSESTHLIDVRSHSERVAFHLGGVNIPIDDVSSHDFSAMKDGLLLFYCQSGQRSLQAAKIMKGAGYKSASLLGGISQFLKFKK
jgi:adenylyltransferase/sulfurtransferase